MSGLVELEWIYFRFIIFKSHIITIPGTNLYLRRDDYIYSDDPLTKEFQIRYVEGVESMVQGFIEDSEVRHANSASLAKAKCQFAKEIIADIRSQVAAGTFTQTVDVTAGAGRNYSGTRPTNGKNPEVTQTRSGDSSRHKLV